MVPCQNAPLACFHPAKIQACRGPQPRFKVNALDPCPPLPTDFYTVLQLQLLSSDPLTIREDEEEGDKNVYHVIMIGRWFCASRVEENVWLVSPGLVLCVRGGGVV